MPEPESIRRATFVAPSNIAFIKYWGIRDESLVLPCNPSISMTLTRCTSKCTAEFDPSSAEDEVWFRAEGESFAPAAESFAAPVRSHLDTLRQRAKRPGRLRVWTENTFPTGAGIASSASGFAALTLAASHAIGSPPADLDEASMLARLSGSGSAARSVLGGYVQWPGDPPAEEKGNCTEQPAVQIAPAGHWDLCDVVAVVDSEPKGVSSRDGHRRAPTSSRFAPRLEEVPQRLEIVRRAIAHRDIEGLGEILEAEAVDLHHVAMSSKPPIYYWRAGTFAVLWALRDLRRQGIPAYATIDAGPNVHAICPSDFEERVAEALEAIPEVELVLQDRVGDGPREVTRHLDGNR
ncbi:MAG: diphosphomevalonate decarboxylase [Thermoanaerobaculia bacterium]